LGVSYVRLFLPKGASLNIGKLPGPLLPAPDSQIGSVAGQVKLVTRIANLLSAAGPAIRFDGADISHYQDDAGAIDWDALAASSWWCATKATQGVSYVDPTFHEHRVQMSARQFKIRLFYHWLDPNSSPTAQAMHFLMVVGKLAAGEGVMLDVEQAGVTAAMVTEWCAMVEKATGRPVVIYTGAFVAGGSIWQSTDVRTSIFGTPRAMHLAAYTSEARALALRGVAAYPWSGWQYSSNGPVAGIAGRCDMNRIDISITTWPPVASPACRSRHRHPHLSRRTTCPSTSRWPAPRPCSSARTQWSSGRARATTSLLAGIQAQLDAGNLVHEDLTGGPMAFAATILKGPLPTGDVYEWTGQEFSNTAQILARSSAAVDDEARAGVTDLRARLQKLIDGLRTLVA
jgi:GH25 family lysozyme M1 (1,4-beta-N-acetylmuramidase)